MCCAAASVIGAEHNDFVIVPGERVGPIDASTTHADLVRMFGASNVTDGNVTVTDAGPEPGSIVFQRDPTKSLTILWNKDKPQPHISYVIVCQSPLPKSCRWHTPMGPYEIAFGTTLKILERINGRPFRLYGFGWDYGGLISFWNDGRLERLRTACPTLGIRVAASAVGPSGKESQAYKKMSGDREYWSSDPAMQVLDPIVDHLYVTFEGPSCGEKVR